MNRLLLAAVIAGATVPTAASAHDFFLLPAEFTTSGTGTINVQATVGSSFPKPEAAVPADRAQSVIASGPGNPQVRIGSVTKDATNLEVSRAQRGLLSVSVTSKPRDVEYGEDSIPLILGEYRVLPPAAAAVEALPRPRTWQVSSRRFAKTFICVRSCGNQSSAQRPVGAHLEFVGRNSLGDHFRLLAHGKPLAGYPVDLVGSDGKRQHLTTDARGDVHLPAAARGTLMLFAAKLEPPAGTERFTRVLTSLTFSRN